MSCKCVRCTECGGTGDVWYSAIGEYLGNSRCDDLDELDSGGCLDCDGTGIIEYCDECLCNYADEVWEDEDYE